MNQLKQNIMVVAILFFSLLSSVVFSYAITPTAETMTDSKHIEKIQRAENKPLKMKQAVTILLPKVVK